MSYTINPRLSLSIALFMGIINLNAQENNHWHFGSNGLGIHFDGDEIPNLTSDTYSPYGWAGCGVLNDQTTGDLVFYTDGQKIIDRMHEIMPNGSGLYGGNSTHSTGKICARPGHPGQYYVFSIETATETSSIEDLYYSMVDINLPGNGTNENPRGDVMEGQKNIWLSELVSESLELIEGDEDQYWLVSPRFYEGVIDVFRIDEDGITLDNSFEYGIEMQDVQAIRYSAVNHKLALGSFGEDDPVLIFSFDHLNGTFSGPNEVPGSFGTSSNQYSGIIDLEWSPDGTKLYLSKYRGNTPVSGGKLFQYDVDNPDQDAILIHEVSSANTHVAKGLRLGPDGVIYWMYIDPESGTSQYIAGILDPNEGGTSCNLQLEYLYSETNLSQTNLFPDSATEYKPEATQVIEENFIGTTSEVAVVIHCYPQPSRENINLEIITESNREEICIEILDAGGKLVYQKKIRRCNNPIRIDTSNYVSGMYSVRVYNEDCSASTQFMKI